MTWKLYALASGGAFLATYLVSGPATTQTAVARPVAQRSTRQVPDDDKSIQELADRLQSRVRAQVDYSQPGRDPFHFVEHRVARPVIRPKPQVIEQPVPVALPPPPLVTLAGIATDQVGGAPQRSAVLSTAAGVLIVREGESVGGLYRVLKIDEETVELEATADGSLRTLRLAR